MTSQIMTSASANCAIDSNLFRSSHPELEHLAATMPAATTDTIRSQSRLSISHAKGLLNMPGQNNCFLNSAVQVLWHLDVFRRNFREITGHACMGDSCIFCALKELFNQFQCSSESALPPDSLRAALAQSFSDQRRFQLGFMDDAAECFENILLRIHYHITNNEISDSSTKCSPHCIPHQKFAMDLYEQIICHSCGATSEPFAFSQMVHYTSTSALCSQEKLFKNNNLSFGSLLKMASSIGDIRNCPKMCGTRINIKKMLVNRPDIISIGLVWDSEHPTLSLIRNVFQIIETNIKLDEVFDLNAQSESDQLAEPQLNLVGLVTYYGKHYSTYLYHTKICQWIYFDDATVRIIGSCWQQVIDKCVKGHFQPLLLLYSNPNGKVINTQLASKQIVPMTVLNSSKNIGQNHAINDCSQLKLNPSNKLKMDYNLKSQQIMSSINNVFNYNKSLKAIDSSIKYYSDVPDSPSATSTTSYFSDIGDSTDGYITRKTVENIMKIQRNSSDQKKTNDYNDLNFNLVNFNKKFNRNSSSSLESFDSVLRQNNLLKCGKLNERNLACSLQRRDSGNSSGDRSSSVSSVDPPPYPHRSRSFKNAQYSKSSKHNSDQGYDSFSISSSDSYPTGSTSSPSKINSNNNKLKQIPEDVQMFDMFNSMSLSECDKLCSEADILLLKSHEKEREGDLRAAAALSDSAALKARVAMDTPYSNHQNLITAKMKHSMCVMRSTSLHKRVQEMEAEEKRLLKSTQEYHHSRQSSRDSTHGRHSRQGSKDGKDPKTSKNIELKQTKNPASIPLNSNVEIYATLPKKAKAKKIFNKHSSSNSANEEYKVVSSKVKYSNEPEFTKNSILMQLNNEKIYDSLMKKKNKPKELPRDSDYSDYCSEWDGLKRKSVLNKKQPASGSQSSRENDSEFYGEIGTITTNQKKQCKVKRKLLLGNLLKTKNRSLPDLREDALKEKDKNAELCEENSTTNRTSVANINAKGFHQMHRSFATEHGVYTKPSLLKVKPPLITDISTDSSNANYSNFATPYFAPNVSSKTEPVISEKANDPRKSVTSNAYNPFLQELNKKRLEIMKNYDESRDNLINRTLVKANHGGVNFGVKLKKPSPHEIATFISNNSVASSHKSSNGMVQRVNSIVKDLSNKFDDLASNKSARCVPDKSVCKPSSNVHVPIAVHPSGGNQNMYLANHISQIRMNRPPDYATAIKRIEMNLNERMGPFPAPPLLQNHYSNISSLNESAAASQSTVAGQPGPNQYCFNSNDSITKLPPAPPTNSQCNPDQPSLINNNQPTQFVPIYNNQHAFGQKSPNDCAKRKTPTKKSVKFSDHIEMVACAEEEREEHLPNPLIEKVFGKNFLYSFDQ